MVEITKISLNNSSVQKPLKQKKFNWKIILWPFVVVLVILLSCGIVGLLLVKPLIAQAQKTSIVAREAYDSLKKQDLTQTSEKIKQTKTELNTTKSMYQRLGFVKFIPLIGSYWQDGNRTITAGQAALDAGEILIEAITPYADILGFKGQGSFSGGTAEDRIVMMVQTLSKIAPKFDDVGQKLKIADENLAKIDQNRYPEKIKTYVIRANIVKAKEFTHEATLAMVDARPVLEVLPQALGYPDTKKYLALFQNDGELRATGGFMTAYGILRMESGRVRAEGSDDIYSLDKKFNSRLKAPAAIAKYLLSADLKTGIVPYYYLRDMNLEPDFKASMQTFLPNYEKIQGQPKVDGIIAIDTKVLQDLLGVVGPIDVPGYGKFTLEPDKRCFDIPQIICELEYIADVPIPGVKVARKDVLGPMMQELILKAMGTPKSSWPQLFKVFTNNVSQKHIIFYFKDEKTQKAAETFNAAGRIQDFKGDYLHINDSNFGGAKSNLFVKQQVEKELIKDSSGKFISKLTITYTNPVAMSNCNLERKDGLCLNGILRDYIRVYVPKGSKLIEGLGTEEKIVTGEAFDKTYFEGFFTLRGGGGRAKVVLNYQLPEAVDTNSLLIQKQPGTFDNHYKVSIGSKTEEFALTTDKQLKN